MRRLFQELKRRNVYRVAATYAVVGFVVVQVADLVFPALNIPPWAYSLVVVLTLLGFPVALVLAWAFEMTPEGVRRTPTAEAGPDGEEAATGKVGTPAETAVEADSRSRVAVGTLVGIGVVAAAAVGAWYLIGGGEEPPEIGERTVAVLPFQVSGSGADTWRDGMVTMLSMGLDEAGRLRAIPDRTVFAAWEAQPPARGGGGVSSEDALSVAREVGARYGVIGSAVALGEELHLAADVHETRSGERLGRVRVEGRADSVTALADSLARGLLGLLLEEGSEGVPGAGLASQVTPSLSALVAYLSGERHYRAGAFEAALSSIGEAPASDTVACVLADARSYGLPVPDSVLEAHLDPTHLENDASLTRSLCTGVYLLERDRTDEARELMAGLRPDEVREAEGRTVSESERHEVVDVLGGYRAWREGDLERAARSLTRSVHLFSLIPSLSWRGLWRGDVLRELGRLEEAEGWYLASWWHPLAHQRLGRLYEEMDRPGEAAAAYERFVAAWEDADEPLQPRVEEARERVAALSEGEAAAGS